MKEAFMRLKKKLNDLLVDNSRNAAEHAFALAMLYKNEGMEKEAAIYGRKAVLLFDKCRMETLKECAAINMNIEGVNIPDIIHQGVVKARLEPLL